MMHSLAKRRYTFLARTLKAGYFVVIVWLFACCEQNSYVTLNGKTMGTYYSIQYRSAKNYRCEIDSILQSFISAASTYDSTSEINHFNRNGVLFFKTPHLFRMLSKAREIHHKTSGAFEPTLMPLIHAHGFVNKERSALEQHTIDSLLSLVSFHYIEFDSVKVKTIKKGVQLDLNAMGEGYAIELLSDFFDSMNISDYKIEIGGEMKCKGRNPKHENWLIGIETPDSDRHVMTTIRLGNEAISTSGNYRKFYMTNGKRQSHIIDPTTGNSVDNSLLSVTIRSASAIEADAFATAGMVMGLDSVKKFVNREALQAFIIYEENGKMLSWHSAEFFDSTQDDQSIMQRQHFPN